MIKGKLREILKKYLSDEEIEKLERLLSEDEHMKRREKIERIKKLIEEGEYDIPPEKVAEKMLEFFRKNS